MMQIRFILFPVFGWVGVAIECWTELAGTGHRSVQAYERKHVTGRIPCSPTTRPSWHQWYLLPTLESDVVHQVGVKAKRRIVALLVVVPNA